MKVLTNKGQALAEEFEDNYGEGNCSCHINPPCGSCTHPGHPECLTNSPEMWHDETEDEKLISNEILYRSSGCGIMKVDKGDRLPPNDLNMRGRHEKGCSKKFNR